VKKTLLIRIPPFQLEILFIVLFMIRFAVFRRGGRFAPIASVADKVRKNRVRGTSRMSPSLSGKAKEAHFFTASER
jgi:hypothetical protein